MTDTTPSWLKSSPKTEPAAPLEPAALWPADFKPTRHWWYNASDGAKIGCILGRIEDIPYGANSQQQFRSKKAAPAHEMYGQFQDTGIACSITSHTIAIDGDKACLWEQTAIGKLLGPWRKVASVIRECADGTFRFHVFIIVPVHLLHLWPKQLPVMVNGESFGHIKSNGFCYTEGVHATGTQYVSTGNMWVIATEELMQAMLEDNGNVLHTDHSGASNCDDFNADAAEWNDPDGEYPEYLAEKVLGDWGGDRNPSLPERCGHIKAAGELGIGGMRTLFSELCAEYDSATERGDKDVHRAYERCYPAYGKVISANSAAVFGVPAVNELVPPSNQPAPDSSATVADLPPESATGQPVLFDPMFAFSDQDLGDACLNAMLPQVKFAADTGVWVWKGPEKWETVSIDSTPNMISSLADHMPKGMSGKQAELKGLDPENPAVQADIHRHERRERLKSAPGSSRVGTKMRSRVSVPGRHPAAIRLADLDMEPGIIWAGGLPWDITASANGPVEAEIDPGTPHLQSCRYTPVFGPTPLWDALITAMFPDKGTLEWALRLLSLTINGHAEKALPCFSGKTNTGKTSLVELVYDVLGSYAVPVSPEMLAGGNGSTMEYARFDLKGARLAFLDEVPRTGKVAQSALKNLTGGSHQRGRPPYGKAINFPVSHVLIATANPESDPPMTDEAVIERLRMVECIGDVTAVRAARQAIWPLNGPAWKKEAPGVLAKLIMIAAWVMSDPGSVRNDRAPAAIKTFSEKMVAEQDSVTQWFHVSTEPGSSYMPETRGSELYENYVAWCDRRKEKAFSPVGFGRKLTKLVGPENRREAAHNVAWYRVKTRNHTGSGY